MATGGGGAGLFGVIRCLLSLLGSFLISPSPLSSARGDEIEVIPSFLLLVFRLSCRSSFMLSGFTGLTFLFELIFAVVSVLLRLGFGEAEIVRLDRATFGLELTNGDLLPLIFSRQRW